MHGFAAILGISAVGLFGFVLLVFSALNPEFHPLSDYVRKLVAVGQPYALWWNLVGLLAVGILVAGFGLAYGALLRDRVVGVLLALFGTGKRFFAEGPPTFIRACQHQGNAVRHHHQHLQVRRAFEARIVRIRNIVSEYRIALIRQAMRGILFQLADSPDFTRMNRGP